MKVLRVLRVQVGAKGAGAKSAGGAKGAGAKGAGAKGAGAKGDGGAKVMVVPKVLALLVALGAVTTAQSAAPVRDGVITGQVVDAGSGKPVSAVVVTLGGTGPGGRTGGTFSPAPRILTGADGRFVFRDLGDGSFSVTAAKAGYAEGAPGRRRPGGASQPVSLSSAVRTADVAIRVWKNGAIGGTVVDEAGEPVVGLQVRLLIRSLASGRQQFAFTNPAAITDDRGIYRFSNLPAGDYLILASSPAMSVKASIFSDVARTGRAAGELAAAFAGVAMTSLPVGDALFALGRGFAVPPQPVQGRLQIYPPTFHPSALTPATAARVTLTAGEERASVDIQLTPVPTARVSGTLVSSSGPSEMTMLRLSPAASDEVPGELLAPGSVTDATGAFTFAAVVPGQYRLRSTRANWIDMPITVGGDDLDGVVATLSPPLRVTATFQFDGNAARPPASQGRFTSPPFTLDPVGWSPGPLSVGATAADQGFTVFGYLPGRYLVRVANSPQGWMFKGALLNGVDVSETPFELTRDVSDLVLTFTDRWSGIGGSVQGPGQEAATVLAFTTDAQTWPIAGANARRLRSARASASGQFGISSLPPGDYYVVAVPEEDTVDWRDPAMLELLARLATQVSIHEGEFRTLDLRVRQVRR